VKIASFNIENMFRRAAVLSHENWEAGKPVLEAYNALTVLLQEPTYSDDDKKRILELLEVVGLVNLKKQTYVEDNKWVVLRRSRGKLISKENGKVQVVAKGRADWVGWLDLKREAVDEVSTRNTAAVIAEVNPDILAVVEAEDRPALVRFNDYVLKLNQGANKSFAHTMLIDGNDERVIDVGLFTKENFPIVGMRSHVDDPGPSGYPLFSRDCAEYEVEVGGQRILLLVNHLKSKGYGKQDKNDERRKAQAERVKKIYEERIAGGVENIVVLGDLNDTPDRPPLAPLLKETSLKDASELTGWVWGEREGTWGEAQTSKLDYLLLSPALAGKVKAGGVNRKGVWHAPGAANPWTTLPTLEEPNHAASDHAAVWVELDL
jgi:endonuclease/exonuclease/phosphatase family metal-dependent hydrolase